MRDVAALAGVGVMTVSRVVNGRGNVGPERTARVCRAIEQLGYRHNHTARNLRLTGQPTAIIGVLVEDMANPFWAELLRAAENVVAEQNCLVLCASSDGEPERERAMIGAFCARRVDGLIVVPCSSDHRYLAPEVRRGTPVVFVDRPPVTVAADTVLSDNFGGARRAVTQLMTHGHTRIGFIGDRRRMYPAAERYRGYLAALSEGGIEADRRLARHNVHSSTAAEHAARELLGSPGAPTAIFTAQHLLTIGTRVALQALGLEREIAQVGFGDVPLGRLVDPGISVMAQSPAALGTLAARMLLNRMRVPDGVPQTVKVPVRLIARGSGELPPRPARPPVRAPLDPPAPVGAPAGRHCDIL
jgi:LacI family transcriptional regulator